MIGDKATAKMLDGYYLDDNYKNYPRIYAPYDAYKIAPRGFRTIGGGAFKTAVRETASGLVYKIPKGSDMTDQNLEYENSVSLSRRRSTMKRLGFEVRVPKTSRYSFDGRVILAQEFVPAKPTPCGYEPFFWDEGTCSCKRAAGFCFGEARAAIADWANLEDVHSDNILIDVNKVMWIVDIGG